jgi:aromatic-L-amino-acid/L-tryptophan decarboxylase
VEVFGRLIEQNVHQAQYLGDLVEAHPELELLTPVSLNVVCFRYRGRNLPADALNPLNEEILVRLQEEGIAVPSGTVLQGRFAIRCANVNHRSRREDFDTLVTATARIGKEVAAKISAPRPKSAEKTRS